VTHTHESALGGGAEGPVDVLVTGAAGLLGQALTRRLLGAGASVQGVDVRAGELPTVRMDVTQGAEVLRVFERLRPRVVVHAATVLDDRAPDEEHRRVNVTGTQNVLDAAAAVGIERLVYISEINVLGCDPGPVGDATTPLALDSPYPAVAARAAAESLVRDAIERSQVPAVIVRAGDLYGPGGTRWVERPLNLLRRRVPVLYGRQGGGLFTHCWVDNLVDAVELAVDRAGLDGALVTVHDGAATPWPTYIRGLARAAGLPEPRVWIPVRAAVAAGRAFEKAGRWSRYDAPYSARFVRHVCRQTRYDANDARVRLGYQPRVALEEGLERLAAHLKRDADGAP